MAKLTARTVETAGPGMHGDGDGLYLQVAGENSRSWIYRYTLNGKTRDLGLGPLRAISLKRARELAATARQQRAEGIDPVDARRALRAQNEIETAKAMTFKDCAERYIAAHETTWRNPKHRQQWSNTLRTYVYPEFGALPVASVDTGLVMKCLEPIWSKKPETASRVRGRIEMILDWAKARHYRDGDNPARWRGHIAHLLPAKSKVRKVEHYPALSYVDAPRFMADVRTRTSASARALEFLILTAARTGDIIGNDREDKPPMRWDHVDIAARMWTIPNTKTNVEHRVPLSDAAVALLKRMSELRQGDIVFPGLKKGQSLSNAAMGSLLKRMAYSSTTKGKLAVPHGMRSTFRDWAAERTNFASEVAEAALAHTIDDKVEAAYRRGDLFDKRRRLMDAWANYCEQAPAATSTSATETVVPFRTSA